MLEEQVSQRKDDAMSNRFFVGAVVLVMGFLVFVFSVVQNTNNDILDRVAQQQEKIFSILHRLSFQPTSSPTTVQILPQPVAQGGGSGAQVAELQQRIQTLEARLAAIESDAKPILDQVKAQQKAYEEQRRQMEEAMKKVHEIDLGNSPVRGNKNAPVTLVEFVDFQCPFCSKFHNVQSELMKAYPNKIKFVIKNYPLPFHPEAKPAAKAALAANEQGKYWDMVDGILKDNSALNAAKYEEIAKSIGLNVDKFRKDLKDKDAQYEKVIADDMALAQKVGARGTPAFYINGRMVMPDMQAMKALIDEALSGK